MQNLLHEIQKHQYKFSVGEALLAGPTHLRRYSIDLHIYEGITSQKQLAIMKKSPKNMGTDCTKPYPPWSDLAHDLVFCVQFLKDPSICVYT